MCANLADRAVADGRVGMLPGTAGVRRLDNGRVQGWRPQGNEVEPAAAGMDPSGLLAAVGEAEARGGRWQLACWRGARCVVDRSSHATGPDLFWLWSASKPFMTVLTWQLVEEGVLGLDDRLTRWWPEFTGRGKDAVTIRHVLQHRSGLPTGPGGPLADALVMHDWAASRRRYERARPRWQAGRKPAYEYLSYGFLLGEVIQRATGRAVGDLVRERICVPLGLADTFLGLPEPLLTRAVPLRVAEPGGVVVERVVNSPRTRTAVIPAGGVSSTAADLARFYRDLVACAAGEGRLLTGGSLAAARAPSTADDEIDGLLRYHMNWSQGFQLGGPAVGRPAIEPMGHTSSRATFGHNGSGVCIGWGDPTSGLAVGYTCNLMRGPRRDAAMMGRLADALLGACR
ncbi:lipase LipE [Brooklawnia cerclae]|uniref:CubicO group peptidase (Beta-lactamase class C family) n=1 Tax=Brooklawnia cerclae TaxID=349934 RepID=A0ABX0SJ17_9ACTN|nr:serine hydrolase domain-containing protein [Brooklawnia cerclae]NIH58329.1 CubicO group peptidase (beta-lactamase class C family) [Brooklawnia cerclae]